MKNKKIILTSIAGMISASLLSAQVTLVEEAFDGDGTNLNGKTATTFAPSITSSGGSSTWIAPDDTINFSRNGAATGLTDPGDKASALLDMGSYINDTAGTDAGVFTLSVNMNGAPSTGNWLGLSFFGTLASVDSDFTTNEAWGTVIYRDTGDIDAWGGFEAANDTTEDGNTFSGAQTISIEIDLTTGTGYNGTDDFGTITFSAGATNLGSHTYTAAAPDFTYIGITKALAEGGTGYFSNLQLVQIPEPGAFALIAGLLVFGSIVLRRRRG